MRQADGSYQHLQTNFTYNPSGQPIYIDQFGEQGSTADDRFIERDYKNPAFPDLVTAERVRDTNGTLLARTTYQYQPGTRLLAAEGHWLLEESRVLSSTYTYDARGLQTAVTDPLSHTTRYGYDAVGNQTVVTDTLGFVTRSLYDAANRRIGVIDALSQTTQFGYDAVGNQMIIGDGQPDCVIPTHIT